ncbi:MAG: hypothetical protein K0Q93_883, partial [Nocardioidaceae bacterium]|nr:hypothetical protein [Nocardioidaceae bacterium]
MIDPIVYWNDALLEANARDHTGVEVKKPFPTRGPTGSSRAFAMVHLAMRDAVVAVRGTKPTYTGVGYSGPSTDAARDAAVAAAAQCTLSSLWPEHEDYFTAHAAGHVMPGGAGMDDGHRVGVEVATALLAGRGGDGAGDQPHYASSSAYGRHRVDPVDHTQPFLGPQWGNVAHFVLQPPHGHIPLDPPPGYALSDYLADAHYKADHDEVRDLGALHSSTRTPDHTVMGHYWAYDGVNNLGTPPRLYNQILRTIATNRGTDVEDMAELFALANVAMADAGIEAWYWKYYYNLWRPVIGIREASPNDGPSGVAGVNSTPDCDPFWLPLGAPNSNQTTKPDFTPPFPAYPSGHATFGAAVFQTIRMFYGGSPITVADVLASNPPAETANAFDFVSDELNGATTSSSGHLRPRHLRRFTDLATPIKENALSRVYLGVHWRFDGLPRNATDNIGGVPLGLK